MDRPNIYSGTCSLRDRGLTVLGELGVVLDDLFEKKPDSFLSMVVDEEEIVLYLFANSRKDVAKEWKELEHCMGANFGFVWHFIRQANDEEYDSGDSLISTADQSIFEFPDDDVTPYKSTDFTEQYYDEYDAYMLGKVADDPLSKYADIYSVVGESSPP